MVVAVVVPVMAAAADVGILVPAVEAVAVVVMVVVCGQGFAKNGGGIIIWVLLRTDLC